MTNQELLQRTRANVEASKRALGSRPKTQESRSRYIRRLEYYEAIQAAAEAAEQLYDLLAHYAAVRAADKKQEEDRA